MNRLLLILLLFLCFAGLAKAQLPGDIYLSIENFDKLKRVRVFKGEWIRFKVGENKTRYYGKITKLRNDSIFFGEDGIKLESISWIRPAGEEEKAFRRKRAFSIPLKTAAIVLPIYFTANTFIYEVDWTYAGRGILLGLALWGVAELIEGKGGKSYNLKKKWQLRILELPQYIEPESQ